MEGIVTGCSGASRISFLVLPNQCGNNAYDRSDQRIVDPMSTDVAVLGGGVGGLTAAHHLAERGFEVTVYEARGRFGGKARSVTVPDTGDPGWPGEHGFRFFPGFYRHVVETMAEIPDDDGTVADNLVRAEETLVASVHGADYRASTETPSTPSEWLEVLAPGRASDVPPGEAAFFAERMLELLTSCDARREAELDEETWWEFLEADRMSEAYQGLVGSTQSLVALQPQRASARTVGRVYLQLLRGNLDPSLAAERVLNAPTSEAWIDPWVEHLRSLGVDLHAETPVTGFEVRGGDVTGVAVDGEGTVTADHYVAAVPVEVMADLLDDRLAAAAPELRGVERLDTAWMNGLQFYLPEDVPVVAGHEIFEDSPWALTAISQAQFWDVDLPARTDGEVEGVLSVIVSDWTEPGVVHDKPARDCDADELVEEVWAQLRAHFDGVPEAAALDAPIEEATVDWFLDPELDVGDDAVTNDSPLLINTVGSLKHRPPADVSAPSLFLAADYVRTNSDLASMESADEAGRRAVRGVLDAADSAASRPEVWDLPEPSVFDPPKAQDRVRYRLGLPHPGDARRSLANSMREGGLEGVGSLLGRFG
jgi:uncharacterized protein with NAD-binding domain and iron-sulfur cluster